MTTDITFHYPPELLTALVDAIPLLCKSKRDVLLFFQGAGVPARMREDLAKRLVADKDSIGKYEIARTVLTRLNEAGEGAIRHRREVVKRVVEFEDLSGCWPEDRLKAKGAVQGVREIVNAKDTFTRLDQERAAEERRRRDDAQRVEADKAKHRTAVEACGKSLCRLVLEPDPQKRGKSLEPVLNELFSLNGIAVRDAFVRRAPESGSVMEQIDGVIELRGDLYLVEMKWHKERLGVPEVSQHMTRVFGRAAARGLIVSASGFADTAIEQCREWLSTKILVFCELRELVLLAERGSPLEPFLRKKVEVAELEKNPYFPIGI